MPKRIKASIPVRGWHGVEATQVRDQLLREINLWFTSPQGRGVLALEQAVLSELLPTIFGYHLVQIGPCKQELFSSSQVGSRVRLGFSPGAGAGLVGNPVQMPFQDDSLDVVLLHHALDFIAHPQELLREAARVTLPSGHLILIGFNPLSVWGLARHLLKFRYKIPWSSTFIRMSRLFDWLDLLNFQIDRVVYGLHGPGSLLRASVPDFSRGLSRHTNWPFGAVYLVVARKWVGSARAIRPNWNRQTALANLQVVKRTPEVSSRPSKVR